MSCMHRCMSPARRYDFCVRCATLLPEVAGALRVKIKLKANDAADSSEDQSLGLGYAHVVQFRDGLLQVASCGPRAARDNSHRNCVSKSKYEELRSQFQELETRTTRKGESRRNEFASPSFLSPQQWAATAGSSDFTSGGLPRLRNGVGEVESQLRSLNSKLRRAKRNTRKVQQCEEELATAQEETAELKSALKAARRELSLLREERDTALSLQRDAERSAFEAKSDCARQMTLLSQSQRREQLLEGRLDVKVNECRRLEESLKERSHELEVAQADLLKSSEEHLAAEADMSEKIARVRKDLMTARAKVVHASGARDEALGDLRKESRTSVTLERELNTARANLCLAQSRERKAADLTRKLQVERDAQNDSHSAMLRASLQALAVDVAQMERLVHGGRGVGEGLVHKVRKAEEISRSLGLTWQRLPNCGTDVKQDPRLFLQNVKFMQCAISDRDPEAIATALGRAGILEQVLGAAAAQPFVKAVISRAVAVLSSHWSARHALMVQFEVHASRAEYDSLRHLLSFTYNHERDRYERITIWRNPADPCDVLKAPAIAARPTYEAERNALFSQCGATSSADGLFCGVQNLEGALANMVQHYWSALDPAVSRGEKELLLVLTGDATGGWRGDSITHGEMSIGSWAKGTGNSRLAALPLFIMEGDDSADNLRNRAASIANQYNALKSKGRLRVTIKAVEKDVKVKLLCAADFQFFKALMNMSKYTSAIWCTCGTDNLYKRPAERARVWQDVLNFYDSIGCVLKDLQTMCELNHYSHEVLLGRKFKPFSCRCGYQSGNEAEWRATVEQHHALDEEDSHAAELAHSSRPEHCRHKPFNPPLLHQPTIDNSADVLHLVFINIFGTFFECTMLIHLNEMAPALRQPFEDYLRSISVPAKIVKAKSTTEMKQSFTGRDAKAIVSRAAEHLPALLEFAHASHDEVEQAIQDAQVESAKEPQDQGAGRRKQRRGYDSEEEYDAGSADDSDAAVDDDERDGSDGDEDDDGLSRLQRDAKSWDAFLTLVYAMRPFERDDPDYREERAVESFNAAAEVMHEYKRLHPNAISACPHVALCVLPRQQVCYAPPHPSHTTHHAMPPIPDSHLTPSQVIHGDHERRGADHSEAFGASIKDTIHRRTLRRRVGTRNTVHKKRRQDGTIEKIWRQAPLRVSRVMQAFRSAAVSETILRDAGSSAYLARKHFRVANTGFATAATAAASAHSKVKPEPTEEDKIFHTVLSKKAMEDITHA